VLDPARIAARLGGLYTLVYNKYFVDELYDATAIRGTYAAARALFSFDRRVVDGAVNGSASLTQIASWFSHMSDKYVVDGAVNLLAWTAERGSFFIRRIQTGLVQNYALLMVLGLFAFLTVFLLAR
jgi:NADH-quinone oxidoreductase subunit L